MLSHHRPNSTPVGISKKHLQKLEFVFYVRSGYSMYMCFFQFLKMVFDSCRSQFHILCIPTRLYIDLHNHHTWIQRQQKKYVYIYKCRRCSPNKKKPITRGLCGLFRLCGQDFTPPAIRTGRFYLLARLLSPLAPFQPASKMLAMEKRSSTGRSVGTPEDLEF